jgi:hypothetical protein
MPRAFLISCPSLSFPSKISASARFSHRVRLYIYLGKDAVLPQFDRVAVTSGVARPGSGMPLAGTLGFR